MEGASHVDGEGSGTLPKKKSVFQMMDFSKRNSSIVVEDSHVEDSHVDRAKSGSPSPEKMSRIRKPEESTDIVNVESGLENVAGKKKRVGKKRGV